MKRLLLILTFALAAGLSSFGQSAIVRDFKPVCDSLSRLIQDRTSVHAALRLKAVMKRGTTLDFYFTESLGDCPWHEGDPQWFRSTLKELFPSKYGSYRLGEVYSKRISLEKFVTPELGFNGHPSGSRHSVKNPARRNIVQEMDGLCYDKGLEGRQIALWQSHGIYYAQARERWEWQRPCLFQTVEDMFTQSFVLPYLVPMLENAGAYVMLPRERDVQRNEVIADNDASCGARGTAEYAEKGKWKDAGAGFADPKAVYASLENPFEMGTARQTDCVAPGKKGGEATVVWKPSIPERGFYAVYISYRTLPKSTAAAHYTVHHLGGETSFVVNQKMGGGTWIYLGTFEFAEGSDGYVSLTNRIPEGYGQENGCVVSADAVRFGGGMGNIARSGSDEVVPTVSGMPRSAEGARYWLQWAGTVPAIYSQNEGKNDYRDDFMSRGDWVDWISGGSSMNPARKGGKGIPVDLSFGFHSDAGVTPNDSIVGTLAIYTLTSDGKQTLPTGESRMTSREYADMVQSQIVNDLRADYDSLWSRRHTWDRSYRESRTPSAPAMLLELLSHQNFADMKYGLDPAFRFTVSRAVYKGMLKYLSNRYGCPYAVQPLPVESMAVDFGKSGRAVVSWKGVSDPVEPTAEPSGYILYTRIDDGGFDNGTVVKPVRKSGRLSTEVSVKPGHIYSYRIVAFNEGGKSFPSETVSIGMPASRVSSKKVLIVNNFDRISGPAFFDSPMFAGFDTRLDRGVPDGRDIAYIGDMYQFRRDMEYVSNDSPGFGASYTDYAGKIVAGNTFDYPYVHGKAVINAGLPFSSCSNEAFCSDTTLRASAWAVDLICGKQVTTVTGSGKRQEYAVFPAEMQDAIRAFTSRGGHVLASGAHIATDVYDQVYPVKTDSTFRVESGKFTEKVLGFKLATNYASRTATVCPAVGSPVGFSGSMSFHNEPNPECYCVEAPDGLTPVSKNGYVALRYADSCISAGISFEGNGYRTVCLGFPIETLHEQKDIDHIIRTTLEFFSK